MDETIEEKKFFFMILSQRNIYFLLFENFIYRFNQKKNLKILRYYLSLNVVVTLFFAVQILLKTLVTVST